jgi:hypothetical protein
MALEATAYSLRFAALRSGFQPRLSLGVGTDPHAAGEMVCRRAEMA